jgi:ApaG protein
MSKNSITPESDNRPVSFTSEATTRGVRVRVDARYSPSHSQPQFKSWLFLYTVKISNESSHVVRLISRHWIIEDANGEREEVRGPGVVGQQPVISPGESYEYTSGCPLTTPFGSMRGTYQMVTEDGDMFDVEIAPFTLSEPIQVH